MTLGLPLPTEEAARPAVRGHDFLRFLSKLTADRHYAGQILHVEEISERPPRFAPVNPALSPPLRTARSSSPPCRTERSTSSYRWLVDRA